jgi:hypothetical protein
MKLNLYFIRQSGTYYDYSVCVYTNKKLNPDSRLCFNEMCKIGRMLFRLNLKDKMDLVQKRVIETGTKNGRKLTFNRISASAYNTTWNNKYLFGLTHRNSAERKLICKLGLDKLGLNESKIITFQVHK